MISSNAFSPSQSRAHTFTAVSSISHTVGNYLTIDMDLSTGTIIACPHCHGKIDFREKKLGCGQCREEYHIENGILLFTDSTYYYPDISKGELKKILTGIKQRHWKEVIYENFYSSQPDFYDYITDTQRANWRFLFDLSKKSIVLDVGAGFGIIAITLATECRVIALDFTIERLLFLQERCRQDHIADVYPVLGNILEAPFTGNTFDIVSLIGTLEWVGESNPQIKPDEVHEIQLRALKEAHRVLKPNGHILIGIENRYGYKYLLGAPDDHTGIPNITYLPRERANQIVERKLQKKFCIYTWGYAEYKNMLQEAGFSNITFYYPIPDYRSMKYLIPLDNLALLDYFLEFVESDYPPGSQQQLVRVLEKTATTLHTVQQHASGYIIVARK